MLEFRRRQIAYEQKILFDFDIISVVLIKWKQGNNYKGWCIVKVNKYLLMWYADNVNNTQWISKNSIDMGTYLYMINNNAPGELK